MLVGNVKRSGGLNLWSLSFQSSALCCEIFSWNELTLLYTAVAYHDDDDNAG